MSTASIILNSLLVMFVIIAINNFLVPFVLESIELTNTVNSWLLLLSSGLINAGTVFQIVGNFVNRNNVLCFNYIKCLICGCFILSIGQLYTYTHKSIRDCDFLISLCGSFASFFFTSTLGIINKYNKQRELKMCNHVPKFMINNSKRIIYNEGTSGVGKTSNAKNQSFDFITYTLKYPLLKSKHSLPYVSSLYDMLLNSDIALNLINFSKDENTTIEINDRHVFSQFAYNVLFYYRGEKLNPKMFKSIVDKNIFKNDEYIHLIYEAMNQVYEAAKAMAPNVKINIKWFIAEDPKFTKQKLIERNEFDAQQSDWNLEFYIENQNYVFYKLHEISGIGDLNIVKLIN